MAVYIGIDLGGTNIKAAVVDGDCNILAEANRPTPANNTPQVVSGEIAHTLQDALAKAGLAAGDVGGVGIGCPGTIDDKAGVVVYSNNLPWQQFHMRDYLLQKTGFSVAMGNDANVAALGEVYAGCARGANSAVVITLGTGVGSGVVLGGRIWTGFTGAAAEMGHTVIVDGGVQCTCGRLGCLESYASATALVRMANEAIAKNPQSGLAKLAAAEGKVNGKTPFDAARAGDETAAAVVKDYIHYLAVGLANVINTFYPEVIGLSGGVSREGENLLAPLREEVFTYVYGSQQTQKKTIITQCTLGYNAGLVGAAMLGKQWAEQQQ